MATPFSWVDGQIRLSAKKQKPTCMLGLAGEESLYGRLQKEVFFSSKSSNIRLLPLKRNGTKFACLTHSGNRSCHCKRLLCGGRPLWMPNDPLLPLPVPTRRWIAPFAAASAARPRQGQAREGKSSDMRATLNRASSASFGVK